jgi:hypothetical protein
MGGSIDNVTLATIYKQKTSLEFRKSAPTDYSTWYSASSVVGIFIGMLSVNIISRLSLSDHAIWPFQKHVTRVLSENFADNLNFIICSNLNKHGPIKFSQCRLP